ncbi:phosphate ABC transporter permease subunit PstC [Aurantimonas sp. Leaf443]|uniref:phosphate ABC transporter permease subunit PstC n=1 Tax=Aurantimonas sp. Leaf443 TaxID=1736378 RepID=UPI0006F81857|nr:phosphate ABC transporter permease subunit PstC [Aurantimonas sp. Leaf443]KQT88120.1 ABC transporter permease [Aurantimonas sp. Leaf443]
MSTSTIVLVVLLIALIGFVLGKRRGEAIARSQTGKLHSRAVYHGSYVFAFAALPALLLLAAWLIVSPVLIAMETRGGVPADSTVPPSLSLNIVGSLSNAVRVLPEDERRDVASMTIDQLVPLLERRGVSTVSGAEDWMVPVADRQARHEDLSRLLMSAASILLAIAGTVFALSRLRLRLKARNQVEQVVKVFLIAASSIAVLTTVGIVSSMLFESLDFFSRVSPLDFFFGTVWEPRFAAAGSEASGQFGLVPLLFGTIYIAFIAMLFAVPIGLFAAIYMAEYASNATRSVVKPLLEVLAGIPTIVYGFFALITVGPFLRDVSAQLNGLVTGDYSAFIQAQSVLTAGLVMGIMLIPFVSSLSDDIITAVPRILRDGSLGLGATKSETVKRVVLPAALPGIVSALLLTASRAIGETMIVVLAAGIAPNITLNPFEAMTTVTIKIVSQLTGDLDFTSPQSLVAFALGITLFFITLCLNIFALYIVRKYREQYE